jgi:hypothetical protein
LLLCGSGWGKWDFKKGKGMNQMPEESWKKIKEFPDYVMSDFGRIYSELSGKLLSPWLNPNGYFKVDLRKNGKSNNKYVHRLVLEAFDRPCPDGKQCNHIDGNKQNNCIANLEWVSRSENMKHAFKMGLKMPTRVKGENHGMSKLTEKRVITIRHLYSGKHLIQKEIGELFGISGSLVNTVVLRKTWRHI